MVVLTTCTHINAYTYLLKCLGMYIYLGNLLEQRSSKHSTSPPPLITFVSMYAR